MTRGIALAEQLHITHQLIDAITIAAYAVWQYNGHDVPSALLAVHRDHLDGQVRAAAGQAYDECLSTPVIWRAFEIDFEQRLSRSADARG
jgi:hypothetical protein